MHSNTLVRLTMVNNYYSGVCFCGGGGGGVMHFNPTVLPLPQGRVTLVPSTAAFAPQSRVQLKAAVDACVKIEQSGGCADGPFGPIGSWVVSAVTDMHNMFENANWFQGKISEWDVSRVTDMRRMFYGAKRFTGDLSKWDVSSVTNMQDMFSGASSFTQSLCDKWQTSQADKKGMFTDSRWKGCLTNTGGKTTSKKALNATNPYPDCDPRS